MNYDALIIAEILLAIIFIAGIYERVVNIPKWFSNPPYSFAYIREHAPKAQKFWIPLQILFFISFILAIVLNWGTPSTRNYMLLSAASYVLVIITTAAYFVKEIMAFSKMTDDTPVTPELLKRAKLWERWTTIRNALQLIGLIFLILAT